MKVRIATLAPDDLAEALALQQVVVAGAPSNFVRARHALQLRAFLDGRIGCAWGARDDAGRLVATALLRAPHALEGGGPPMPGIPAEDWLTSVAFLEGTLVLPAARGAHLQRRMVMERLAHAREAGWRWLASGVHMGNIVSRRNLEACGFRLAAVREDFGWPVGGFIRPVDP